MLTTQKTDTKRNKLHVGDPACS